MCWLWSALKNQPSPGATGIKACPSFYDLDLVVRENCVYKVVDPSFHNWTGLALAMRGQALSDFPLCNKSFNLSYCGFDL